VPGKVPERLEAETASVCAKLSSRLHEVMHSASNSGERDEESGFTPDVLKAVVGAMDLQQYK